ncbi:MAG: Adaptive-response sensory-kinase SasA [Parabacteroides sp.]
MLLYLLQIEIYMKIRYIRLITILGLIAIVLLQMVWLCRTYSLLQEDITNKSYRALQNAVALESVHRLEQMGENPDMPKEIIGGAIAEEGEIIDQSVYYQDILLNFGYPMSFSDLDSIYASKLEKEEIHTDFVLNRINVKDKSVLQSTDSLWKSNWASVEIPVVPVRMDGSEGIQAILLNPYWTIFRRLGLLLIATALMMLFVAACIIYQIRIIARQNRIAKMRKDFSSAMIHDMKTPLSSIQMGIRILQSGKLEDKPEKKEKHFRIIEEEAEHLLDLTNKVLTISKMETGKLDLNKEQFDITPLLLDLKEKFIAKTKKSVIFAIDVQNKEIWGDKEYLKEAVSNLIDNAIKYSGETVHIDILVRSEGAYTLIRVKDDGFGISHENQKKIFEKFERASAAGRSSKGGATGFGLGLNFVQGIVETHQGKVQLDSIEGEFSEFTLYIPNLIKDI